MTNKAQRHLFRLLAASMLMSGGSTQSAFASTVDPVGVQPERPLSATPAVQVPPVSFTTRTLPNGLRVHATRDRSTPNVHVQMIYHVGSKDDPAGRSGLAHLFEHIVSRVTRNIAPGQIGRLVEEEAGGSRGALTSPDRTRYYETVPANRLEAVLWMHAERMGRSVLDQSIFETERNVVKEEMRERILSTPYGRLQGYHAFENTFVNHPYQRQSVGTIPDLDAATLEDARAFHENFYRPDNATLVVSGNFEPAQLDRWVDRHLATIPSPARPILRHIMPVRQHPAARSIAAYGPNVPLPAVMLSWQRPKGNHRDHAALEVLTRIIGAGESSRLNRGVVRGRQLASSALALGLAWEEAGALALFAIVAGGKEPAAVEAALKAEAARLRDEPVSDGELREAITEYVSAELFRREGGMGRGEALAEGVVVANDPAWSDRMLAAVQQVTARDVRRVARRYLRDDRRVTIIYLDESRRQGPAGTNPWERPTSAALGRSLPPAVSTPNQLAPEGQRMAPPGPGLQRPIAAPAFAERRLANGMRVVIARSTNLPLGGAYLIFGGGAAADPAGRPGVANMMAGLLDNGTTRLGAVELSAAIERLGAKIGASVGPDSSTAFVTAPAATLEEAGRLLSEMVRSPAFAQNELDRERGRALDQLRVVLRQPGSVANLALRRVMFGDAPYGAASATPESLAALTRADLVSYYANWWRPDNAALIIVGSLDEERGFALAERLFGGWGAPASPMPPLPANRAGTPGTPRVVVIDMPEADQASVSVALRAATRSDEDYFPLLLANSMLGGGPTGRLFQEVRVKRALSYGAYSWLEEMRDESVLVAHAMTRNDAAPEVAAVMLGEIRRLTVEPLTTDQLERRRTWLAGNFGRQVESISGFGSFLSRLATQSVPMREFSRHLDNIGAVTPEQISRSVAAELDPSQASIVIAGRAGQFIDRLRARHPDVEVIPLDRLDFGTAALAAPPR